MKLRTIITETTLIKNYTKIWIKDEHLNVLAHGNWYENSILKYLDAEITYFTWLDNDNFYVWI